MYACRDDQQIHQLPRRLAQRTTRIHLIGDVSETSNVFGNKQVCFVLLFNSQVHRLGCWILKLLMLIILISVLLYSPFLFRHRMSVSVQIEMYFISWFSKVENIWNLEFVLDDACRDDVICRCLSGHTWMPQLMKKKTIVEAPNVIGKRKFQSVVASRQVSGW